MLERPQREHRLERRESEAEEEPELERVAEQRPAQRRQRRWQGDAPRGYAASSAFFSADRDSGRKNATKRRLSTATAAATYAGTL